MQRRKKTILIPAFNASSTIVETLTSIQGQSEEALSQVDQVIVVDDHSTDETSKIARRCWHRESPILAIRRNQANKGERATCNGIFKELIKKGCEWCCVLHADDVAKGNWLTVLFAAIDQHSDLAASICSSWDNLYAGGRIVAGEDIPSAELRLIRGSVDEVKNTLMRGCWWHFSGCAVNLSRFEEVGFFDESMPQLGDLDWLLRALLSGKNIVYIPQTLIYYRNSSTNVSSTSFATNRDLREAIRIASKLRQHTSLRFSVNKFTRRQLVASLRRSIKRLAQGQITSAFSAFTISIKSLLQLVKG